MKVDLTREELTTIIIITETKFSEPISPVLETKLHSILKKLYAARDKLNKQD